MIDATPGCHRLRLFAIHFSLLLSHTHSLFPTATSFVISSKHYHYFYRSYRYYRLNTSYLMAPITIAKAKSKSPSPKSSTTFSQTMADEDLESIGRHCQLEYCGQLDFLPFKCGSCQKTFCLEHRSETAHKCARAGEWARRRDGVDNSAKSTPTEKPTIYNSDQCYHVNCKTLINTMKDPGVRCPQCQRQYCLKHRLGEQHDCAKVVPLGARPAGPTTNDTLKSMFSRVRTWGKDKGQAAATGLTPKPKQNSPAARVARVNTMKRTAKGDAKVPAERRIYLHVVGTSDTEKNEPPVGDFFFDTRWKVGRVLDDAAKRLQVENNNNRVGEEGRLRIFHIESGDFLDFSETIGQEKVQQGHTIVMLRGAGVMLGK